MTESLVDASPRVLAPDLQPVGPLGFGCWRFTGDDVDASRAVLEVALDAGMNLVDTADVYGLDWGGSGFGANESLLGRVLVESRGLRDRMVLVTKGGIRPPVPYDQSPQYLREACEASLRRLGVDVIDVYLIHRPDLFTHPASAADTLAALREEGKIRAVGVSNFTPSQHEALQAHLPFPIAVTQPEFSAARLDPLRDGTLDLCMRDGVVPLAWSPLAGGRLVGGGAEDVRVELLAVLDELAAREGVDRAAIAYAFVLSHPSRPVAILGTQNPDRIERAVGAFEVVLDRADVYRIVEASEGAPLP
jgi:aryl-alcohol dehydrogenase-like predicted oxidoreductase